MKKFRIYSSAVLAAMLLLAAVLLSCNGGKAQNEGDILDERKWSKYKTYGQYIEVITIDSCEYLYSYNFNATWCTHKGNCKFCVARHSR